MTTLDEIVAHGNRGHHWDRDGQNLLFCRQDGHGGERTG